MTENNRLPRLDLHCHLDGSLSHLSGRGSDSVMLR